MSSKMKEICTRINRTFCSERHVFLWDDEYEILAVNCDALPSEDFSELGLINPLSSDGHDLDPPSSSMGIYSQIDNSRGESFDEASLAYKEEL